MQPPRRKALGHQRELGMKTKLILVSTTALALVMSGGAYAGDNNDARLWQNGANNNAATDQTSAHNSTIGTVDNLAGQIGDGNYLTITQVAGHNSTGTGGQGIDQNGNYNYLSLYQGYQDDPNWNPYNSAAEIHQGGYSGSNPGFYVNQAAISQYYNDSIDSIWQTYTGSASDGRNYVAITQHGSGASGNHVNSVNQTGHDNTLSLQMTNEGGSAANGAGSFTVGNVAAIVANPGAYGILVLPPNFQVLGQASVYQNGSNNNIGFTVDGNGNLFGFEQLGQGNSVAGGISGGLNDEVAVVQDGIGGNAASISMSGAYNDLGIMQLGGANTASAAISGSSNHAGILQFGEGGANAGTLQTGATSSGNLIGVIQYASGGSNTGNVNVASGGGNVAVVGQYASSGTNSVGITISGNNNNALVGSNPNAFTPGRAASNINPYWGGTIQAKVASLGGSTVLTDTLGSTLGTQVGNHDLLTPGLVTQFSLGGSNALSLNVTGDSNLFSTTQLSQGGSNSLTSTIVGSSNELAVAQLTVGGTNSAVTSQVGYGNSMGITQTGTNNANVSQ
jgi:hypothetical protein